MNVKNQIIEREASSDVNAVKIPEGLFFNILPFIHPQKEIDVSFSLIASSNMAKFSIARVPDELQEQMLQKGRFIPSSVYTDFRNTGKGYTIPVNLEAYPAVARAYYTKKIRDILAEGLPWHRCNFLKDTQYWCLSPQQKYSQYKTFDKFTLRVQFGFEYAHPELLVSYDGKSFLLNRSVEELSDDMEPGTQLVESVAWNKRICSLAHLPEEAKYHNDEVYPLLNRELAEHLGLKFPFEMVSDNVSVFYKKVHSFVENWCSAPEFRNVIPYGENWKQAREENTGLVSGTQRKLEFGQGGKDSDPYKGIENFGPLKLPEGNHFSYFFIYFEEHEYSARQLYKYILQQEGSLKVSKFTRIPIRYEKAHNIVIRKGEDPEAKVAEHLQTMASDVHVKRFAFYVSPYSRFESDEKKKALYFRIKEQLLYRNISMQAVEYQKLEKDFKYAVSNIGIALIAKLGGVPWKLEGSEKEELVIGFGAYRNSGFGIRYTGSAICFSHNGVFQEFDVFPAANTLSIAGAAVDAFRQYREHNPEAKRMIIHFYKKMRREELEPLEKMLRGLKFDIPVIVAGISKTRSKSLLLFDNPQVNAMPVDGTWAKVGKSAYLLNINLRRSKTSNQVKQTFPLKITLQCNREGYLEEEGRIDQLLEQVYAFSFMHWRSVRQSPLPVTVKYPAMIASFMPWFKTKMLPAHGRTVPWFL
jgi:hypothetical protein